MTLLESRLPDFPQHPEDGFQIKEDLPDGGWVIWEYNAAHNEWTYTQSGTPLNGYLYTDQVLTRTESTPMRSRANQPEITNQKEVNHFLADNLGETGVVKKAGDTMTGPLLLEDENDQPLGLTDESDPATATNKQYVDQQDEGLRQDIIELEEEIDAIAPTLERGSWTFNVLGSAQPNQYALSANGAPTNIYPNADAVYINSVDKEGQYHDFSDVVVDSYIEIFSPDDGDYGLYRINAIHDETQGANSFWWFEVTSIRSNKPDANAEGTCKVKFFNIAEGADATSFVLKAGDDVNGNLTMVKEPFNNGDLSPEIRFKTKKTDGTVYTSTLYMPLNTSNTLKASGYFATGGTITCGGAIQLSGNVQYGSSTRLKLGSDTTTHYLGFGTSDSYKALQWTKSLGVTSLRVNNSTGSSGQVLTRTNSGLEWKTPATSSAPQYTITYSNGNYYIS